MVTGIPKQAESHHPGGGGGTLIFSYIRMLGPFLGVQNLKFQYFFRWYENLVDIFWGSSQNLTGFRDHFLYFKVFPYRVGICFWVDEISNIFWVCLILNSKCWVKAYIMRVSPHPLDHTCPVSTLLESEM